MTVGDLDLLVRPWFETLARIGATDMSAQRTPQPLRIFGAEQEVVVGFKCRIGYCEGPLPEPSRVGATGICAVNRCGDVPAPAPARDSGCAGTGARGRRIARIANERRSVSPAADNLGGDEFLAEAPVRPAESGVAVAPLPRGNRPRIHRRSVPVRGSQGSCRCARGRGVAMLTVLLEKSARATAATGSRLAGSWIASKVGLGGR